MELPFPPPFPPAALSEGHSLGWTARGAFPSSLSFFQRHLVGQEWEPSPDLI